mgnify:CR=1 FL=1
MRTHAVHTDTALLQSALQKCNTSVGICQICQYGIKALKQLRHLNVLSEGKKNHLFKTK